MKKVNLYTIAKNLQWLKNLAGDKTKAQYIEQAENNIEQTCKNLPSGSGIDAGTKISMQESKPNKIVFAFSFHHMDEKGSYDGWTDHKAIFTPSFDFGGYKLRITGKDRNQIKNYLYELFGEVIEFNCLAK